MATFEETKMQPKETEEKITATHLHHLSSSFSSNGANGTKEEKEKQEKVKEEEEKGMKEREGKERNEKKRRKENLNVCALILTRGSSKSIPGKNIRSFNGYPLIVHSLKTVLQCRCSKQGEVNYRIESSLDDSLGKLGARLIGVFTSFWVSTDDSRIIDTVQKFYPSEKWPQIKFHFRSEETSRDTSSSISAVQEFLDCHQDEDWDAIALIQVTSPIQSIKFLTEAYQKMEEGAESVFSVFREKSLRWSMNSDRFVSMSSDRFVSMNSDRFVPMNSDRFVPMNSDRFVPMNSNKLVPMNSDRFVPMNFDPKKRPRRQDMEGELVESGHFYFARIELLKSGLFQSVDKGTLVEIPPECCIELDYLYQWPIAEFMDKQYRLNH